MQDEQPLPRYGPELCCWLGVKVPHTHVNGEPCDVGEEEAVAARQAKADADKQRREYAWAQGRLVPPPAPDEEGSTAPARPRRRAPRVAPPPLPDPTWELMARLESERPDDPFGLGEQLRGWESLARRAAAEMARVTTRLEGALRAQDEAMDVPLPARDDDAVAGEVALLVQCSDASAQRRVGTARVLATRLPFTWQALSQGRTSFGAVLVLAEVTEGLSPEQCSIIEAGLWPCCLDLTPSQVRRRARVLVARHAAEVVAEREAQAAAVREASRRHDPAGGASSIELLGPADEVEALWQAATALAGADRDRTPGDGRTLDQRRFDAICEAVKAAALEHLAQPGVVGTAWDERCRLHVTVDLDTLLGLDDRPGRLSGGIGTVSAAKVRELAIRALEAGAQVERIITCPTTGIALDATIVPAGTPERTSRTRTPKAQDPAKARLTRALDRHIAARDQHCIHPSDCPRPPEDCDRDHLEPTSQGGLSTAEQVGLRCRPHHHTKQHPAFTVRRITGHLGPGVVLPVTITTSRTGHHYPARPPDLRE